MEAVIRLKPSELTPDFIDKVKSLFKNDETIEVSFSSVTDFGLTGKESQEEYIARLNRAIKNLEEKRDTVSFSEEEFKSLVNDLNGRK